MERLYLLDDLGTCWNWLQRGKSGSHCCGSYLVMEEQTRWAPHCKLPGVVGVSMLELACYYTSSPGGSQRSKLLSVWANGRWFQYRGWSRMRTFPHCSLDIPVPWLRQILSKLCVQILFSVVRNYNYTQSQNILAALWKLTRLHHQHLKKKSLAVSLLWAARDNEVLKWMQGSVIITAILRSRHTRLEKEGIIVLELGRGNTCFLSWT